MSFLCSFLRHLEKYFSLLWISRTLRTLFNFRIMGSLLPSFLIGIHERFSFLSTHWNFLFCSQCIRYRETAGFFPKYIFFFFPNDSSRFILTLIGPGEKKKNLPFSTLPSSFEHFLLFRHKMQTICLVIKHPPYTFIRRWPSALLRL